MKKILLLTAVAATMIFVFISCGDDNDEPAAPENHEYVDLGLPSGTLWATCNVGATAPEEFGDHFAWGETTPKDFYDYISYKWCTGTYETMTKYCTDDSFGTIDGKNELDPEDDAAYVNWGPSWRMPTREQIKELIELCSWEWTTRNGVYGQLGTGPNGNTLFLPAAGSRMSNSLDDTGLWGYYWSRNVDDSNTHGAYDMYFHAERVDCNSYAYGYVRYLGNSVRAVRNSRN